MRPEHSEAYPEGRVRHRPERSPLEQQMARTIEDQELGDPCRSAQHDLVEAIIVEVGRRDR